VISSESGDHIEFEFFNGVLKHFLSDMTGLDDLILSKLSASDYTTVRARAVNMMLGVAGTNPTVT
jgi:hypothetical protein